VPGGFPVSENVVFIGPIALILYSARATFFMEHRV